MRRDEIRFAALESLGDTQQADDIGIIRVEELTEGHARALVPHAEILAMHRNVHVPSVCPVNAHFIDLSRIFPKIFHMAQDMTAAVLTDEVTQIRA